MGKLVEETDTPARIGQTVSDARSRTPSLPVACAPSPDALQSLEGRLGISLPEPLRAFYTEIGDGGAGPAYGLLASGSLRGYRPDAPYPGIEVYRQLATDTGTPPDESGYFEISRKALSGLLTILDIGCGDEICLITKDAQQNRLVHVSCNGFVAELNTTMPTYFEAWVDGEIERFEAVEALMYAGASYAQICREVEARFKVYDAGDRIASLANVPFPVALFGTPDGKIYHGATQFPWYERVLEEWQAKNGSSTRKSV